VARVFALGEQSGKGSAASTLYSLPTRSMNLTPSVETLFERVIEGRDDIIYAEGGIKATGTVEMFMTTESLLHSLKAFFLKAPAEQNLDSYAKEYTFTPWDYGDTLKYFTMVGIYDSSNALQLLDAAFDRLEISIEAGEIPRISGDILAAKAEKISPPTYSAWSKPIHGFHLATVKIGGATVKAKSVTLTFENNLTDDYFLIGQRELADLLPGEFNVEAEIEIHPQDWTLIQQYLNQPNPVAVEISVIKDEQKERFDVSFDAILTAAEFPVEAAEIPGTTVRCKCVGNLSVKLREPT